MDADAFLDVLAAAGAQAFADPLELAVYVAAPAALGAAARARLSQARQTLEESPFRLAAVYRALARQGRLGRPEGPPKGVWAH